MWILVKAYPQPSTRYQETVCCAGVSETGDALLRLYPIRYRTLRPEQRFDRYDLVEMKLWQTRDDQRPESRKVVEDSIRKVPSAKLSARNKVKLWLPFIVPSLKQLQAEQKTSHRSLGIIRPDPGSIRLAIKRAGQSGSEDDAIAQSLWQQANLYEDALKPLPEPEYGFIYSFTSGGHPHTMQIHDWEVQAAYVHYKRRYGSEALDRLRDMYENQLPVQNLHFIMGNMHRSPWQFIIVGLLRSKIDPAELTVQHDLL